MEFESPLKKKRAQEKTVERPKRCFIHDASGANSTISVFTEQSWKVNYILIVTAS